MKPFTFKIGGAAGTGVTSAGLTFSKIAVRSGYYTFDYIEYPSIVRGGHNVMQTAVSDKPIASQFKSTDFLVALDQQTVDQHNAELSSGSILLYDADQKISVAKVAKNIIIADIPLSAIARETGGNIVMRYTVAIGAALFFLSGSLKHLEDLLAEEFSKKDSNVVKKNYAVAEAGYNYAKNHFGQHSKKILNQRKKAGEQIVINGNEAAALGSIAAGMQFAAIYPMTPTSNILHVLAPLQKEFGFIYKQPEDEISAINMAIGAAFAGARSMTATSGGGFCLMTEGFGLAGMTETPVVIIMGSRPGPATGLPTWTEQGDANFVLHAHQGDFPRIVLAPGDINEVFHITMEAFNLADKYQTPVVVLIDKHLCESHQSIPSFDYKNYKINRGKFIDKKVTDYARYALSKDGISLRAPAGSGNHVIANSDEHNINGYSTEESAERKEQMEKRMQKLITCEKEDMMPPVLYGPRNADLTIVSWGSNKGAILEALKEFSNVNFLQLSWLNPFPKKEVVKILNKAKNILNVECNYSAQVGGIITEKTGIIIKNNFLKYDGRPFYPDEIKVKIKKLL